ncbi:MAG: disulfide bond formation protein B, partial [Gammaproteobacteria bacterium]|nr:disulfide bond formation protein B [Gammaproteobacteria bacterium]
MTLRFNSADYALAAIALCGVLLFGAEIMEHRFAMDPCPMCLMQRLWIFAAGLAAYAGLAHNPRWGIYPLLTIVASLIGGAVSAHQLWLQSSSQLGGCGRPAGYMIDNSPWRETLSAMFFGDGSCQPSYFLGLDLALWALLGFAALIALAA